MMKLTVCAAALIAVAAFVTVPAGADYIGSGPIKQNGKCWRSFDSSRGFGAWIECPSAASGAGVPCSAGQLAWEKAHTGQGFFDHCGRNGSANANASPNAAAKPAATNQRVSR